MAHKVVLGLIPSTKDISGTLNNLNAAGFPAGEISLIAKEQGSIEVQGDTGNKILEGAASTATGAVPGGLAGGLVGALLKLGINEEDAKVYVDHISQGSSLVMISPVVFYLVIYS